MKSKNLNQKSVSKFTNRIYMDQGMYNKRLDDDKKEKKNLKAQNKRLKIKIENLISQVKNMDADHHTDDRNNISEKTINDTINLFEAVMKAGVDEESKIKMFSGVIKQFKSLSLS